MYITKDVTILTESTDYVWLNGFILITLIIIIHSFISLAKGTKKKIG
jgi:hypothetical protein